MSKAIYAFSGDPVTYGHLDIIQRAANVFDEVVVGIGVNPGKKYLFSLEERTALARQATSHIKNVKVISFTGLLVDYAYENNVPTIIRGLRNSEDFNFEIMLHQIGESQKMHIDTFFIPSRQDLAHVSSSAAKALQSEQGLIHEYVPLNVKQQLEERLSGQYIVAVTGVPGAGKSFICEQLKELGRSAGIEVHRIDVDRIGHQILETLTEDLFVKLRLKIAEAFGRQLLREDGFIDRAALGKIVFGDMEKLNILNSLMYQPMLLRMRRELYGKKGLILLDTALIAESRMTFLCNNNVLVVTCSPDIQLQRLQERGYSKEKIDARIASQYNPQRKLDFINKEIERTGFGKVYKLENNTKVEQEDLQEIFSDLVSKFSVTR